MLSIACDSLTLEVVTADSLEFIDDELSAEFSGMLGWLDCASLLMLDILALDWLSLRLDDCSFITIEWLDEDLLILEPSDGAAAVDELPTPPHAEMVIAVAYKNTCANIAFILISI